MAKIIYGDSEKIVASAVGLSVKNFRRYNTLANRLQKRGKLTRGAIMKLNRKFKVA